LLLLTLQPVVLLVLECGGGTMNVVARICVLTVAWVREAAGCARRCVRSTRSIRLGETVSRDWTIWRGSGAKSIVLVTPSHARVIQEMAAGLFVMFLLGKMVL
jgi:hypothetical protein